MREDYPNNAPYDVTKKFNKLYPIECDSCEGEGDGMFSCCTGELITDELCICPTCLEHLGVSECTECEGTGEKTIQQMQDEYESHKEDTNER